MTTREAFDQLINEQEWYNHLGLCAATAAHIEEEFHNGELAGETLGKILAIAGYHVIYDVDKEKTPLKTYAGIAPFVNLIIKAANGLYTDLRLIDDQKHGSYISYVRDGVSSSLPWCKIEDIPFNLHKKGIYKTKQQHDDAFVECVKKLLSRYEGKSLVYAELVEV